MTAEASPCQTTNNTCLRQSNSKRSKTTSWTCTSPNPITCKTMKSSKNQNPTNKKYSLPKNYSSPKHSNPQQKIRKRRAKTPPNDANAARRK